MKTVLFVCTGNTCRSPMAACLFNDLARRSGQKARALSAGIGAVDGLPASQGARRAMARRGLSLEGHASQELTEDLLQKADLVVGMTDRHVALIRAMGAKSPLYAFDDPPITDPYGGGDDVYEQAARDIQRQLPALMQQLES